MKTVLSKDGVILVLIVVATTFISLFYRERQVVILQDRFVKTESLLKNVKWNEQSRNYLLQLGYNIPVPKAKVVVKDTTNKGDGK